MTYKQRNFLHTFILFTFGVVLLVAPISPSNLNLENHTNFYPDFLTCLIIATIIINPRIFPASAVIVLCFFSDILFMKPIGLDCSLIFLTTEIIRRYHKILVKEGFLKNFFLFFICLLGIKIFNIFFYKLFFIPMPDLILVTKQLIYTTIFYPLFHLPMKFFLKRE